MNAENKYIYDEYDKKRVCHCNHFASDAMCALSDVAINIPKRNSHNILISQFSICLCTDRRNALALRSFCSVIIIIRENSQKLPSALTFIAKTIAHIPLV